MSRYVVRITGPAGHSTYLSRGREVGHEETATHYPHPSNAEAAALAYRKATPGVYVWDVIDTRDPESEVRLDD